MKMKKQLLALLLAAVMVLSLTGCKETLKKVAQKVTGHSEEVQEEDTTRQQQCQKLFFHLHSFPHKMCIRDRGRPYRSWR